MRGRRGRVIYGGRELPGSRTIEEDRGGQWSQEIEMETNLKERRDINQVHISRSVF